MTRLRPSNAAAAKSPSFTVTLSIGSTEHVSRDLRHDRIGAGADIGRGTRHFRVTVAGQHDASGRWHL